MNQSVTSMSVHGASPKFYRQTENVSLGRIKKKKLSEISITGNKITQEPDNPSKKEKVDSSIDETKSI